MKGIKFPHEGALDWRMVSSTSLGDRKLWVWPLGGHTHSFHNSGRGSQGPPAVRGDPPGWESQGESSRRKSGPRTITARNSATRSRLTSSAHSRQNSRGVERRGKGVQTKPRPFLYHSIQPQGAGMNKRVPEGGHCAVSDSEAVH